VAKAEGKFALARSMTERALAIAPDFDNARVNLASFSLLEVIPRLNLPPD